MNGFLRTVVLLAAALGLLACSGWGRVCKNDEGCPSGSFCLKTGKEGLCSWGQWAQDDDGNWAILPRIEFFGQPIETDSENPRLRRLRTSFRGFQFHILASGASGASTVPLPQAGEDVKVGCEDEDVANDGAVVFRTCTLEARTYGEYIIRVHAENDNGRVTVLIHWQAG